MKSSNVPILAVDFFCGAGGMTNGLIKANIHVLAGVDNEPACEKTFRQNKNRDGSHPEYLCKNIFPKSRIHPGGQQEEIRVKLEKLIAQFKRDKRVRAVKLVFAICAPCQPFTKITKIEMSEGRQFKRTNDANLLLTTVELVRHFQPDAIVCENVEGMARGDSDSVLLQFKRRLIRAGYTFDAKVINAAKFGVPQYRRRTIGLGFKSRTTPGRAVVPIEDVRLKAPRTVEAAIGHLPPLAAGETHPKIKNHRARALNDLNLKRIASVKPGESNLVLRKTRYGDLSLDCHRDLEKRAGKQSFSDTYTRMRPDSPAPTITTKCISITNGRFGHYDVSQNRGISAREAALLQTFPQGYVFYPESNIHFTALLIGNAVPPKLATFFGKLIATRLHARG